MSSDSRPIALPSPRAIILRAAEAHLEDLQSGVEEGIYDRAENELRIAELKDAIGAVKEAWS